MQVLQLKKFMLHRLFDFVLAGDSKLPWIEKLEYFIKAIIASAPVLFICEGLSIWFDDNKKFFAFMIATIFISMFTGGVMHWKKDSFNIKTLLVKTMTMCGVIICSYMVLEFIVQTLGSHDTTGIVFQKTIQIATILYPGTKY